jgi:hypothetical protein
MKECKLSFPAHKFVLIFFTLLGSSLIIIGTSKYGVGLTGDSVNYISLADNIYNGRGLIGLTGEPFVLWSPGYSLVIFIFRFVVGLGQNLALLSINIISFVSTLLLCNLILKRYLSDAFRLYALFLITIAPGFYLIWVMAFAEVVFIPLSILFFLISDRARNSSNTRNYFLLATVAVILPMVKYIGIVFFPLVIYEIYNSRLKNKIKLVIICTAIMVIPFLIILIKNYAVVGSLFGVRGSSSYSLGELISSTIETFAYWIFPVVLSLLIVLRAISKKRGLLINAIKEILLKQKPFILFSMLFYIATVLSSLTTALDEPNNRLLIPLFIPLLIILLTFFEKLWNERVSNSKFIKYSLILGLIVPILMYARTDIRSFTQRVEHGSGSIMTTEYQNKLPMMPDSVISKLKGEQLFCNNSAVLYFKTKLMSKTTPRFRYYNSPDVFVQIKEISNYLLYGEKSYILWLTKFPSDELYSLQEIETKVRLLKKASGDGWELYEVQKNSKDITE